jgi:hypothetical protein
VAQSVLGPIAEDGMKTYQDIKKRIETVISLTTFKGL